MFVARKRPAVPEQFETDRLIIRAPQPNEGKIMNDSIRESFDELRAWMPWAQSMPSIAESETFVREAALRYRNHEDLPMLMFRKSDGAHVGNTGMHNIDWEVPRFEIGYWLRTSLVGQGYMTEAVIGLTNMAFEKLGAERMEIRCDARNLKSAAVAQRAGYTLEAKLRHDSRSPDGALRDSLIFARLREEWEGE